MDSKKASRRKFLKSGAAAAAASAIQSATGSGTDTCTVKRSLKDEVAYGERSHYVTSMRIAVTERPSPDEFGLTFHVLTPLQDSVGIITPSSLHYVGDAPRRDCSGHRSQGVSPDDSRHGGPAADVHHGRVEALPVRNPHLIFSSAWETARSPTHKTVQQTHGMTSCSEWTGVPLSLLLKEAGVQKGASWVVVGRRGGS